MRVTTDIAAKRCSVQLSRDDWLRLGVVIELAL
jgi:hypothetical protein